MGEPGTKIVLSILTRIAETIARHACNVRLNHYFQSAGDDQLSFGARVYYYALYGAAPVCGLKPSKDKFGMFKYAVMFCE